jgi:hypothetical protein
VVHHLRPSHQKLKHFSTDELLFVYTSQKPKPKELHIFSTFHCEVSFHDDQVGAASVAIASKNMAKERLKRWCIILGRHRKVREYFKDLDVDGKTIKKLIIEKYGDNTRAG